MIRQSEPTFSSVSCSKHKTAEIQKSLWEVIYWLGLCKWPRADPFLGTGFESKHKLPKAISLSLIFCPVWLPGSITEDCSGSYDPTHTQQRMLLARGLARDDIMKLFWFWGFVVICASSLELSFSLPSLCRFSHSAFVFRSTVLTVIPWPVGVGPCASRMGQLHGVLFLPPTMVFSIRVKWMLQGVWREKTEGMLEWADMGFSLGLSIIY